MMIWLCLLMSFANAGYLRMQSESQLVLQKNGSDLVLSGTYQIENQGDETAYEVFPEFSIDEFRWQGQPLDLKAGEKFVWEISQTLTPESLCLKESPNCFIPLPSQGQFLVRVRKFYRDQNGYPFVVPDIHQVAYPQNVATESSVQVSVNVVSNDNQEFEAHYRVLNQSSERIVVHLAMQLPDEVEVLGPPQKVEMIPNGEQTGILGFRNAKGLTDSEYILILTAQWQQKGLRQFTSASTTFHIQKKVELPARTSDEKFLSWFAWALFVGLLGMWIFWIRPVQKLNS